MNAHNREIILIGPLKPLIVKGLDAVGTVHKTAEAKDADAFYLTCQCPGDRLRRHD